jgi:hypothetical protein
VAEADACEVCAANAEEYNPLVISADDASDDVEPVRLTMIRAPRLRLLDREAS